jgi:hypothetical protein
VTESWSLNLRSTCPVCGHLYDGPVSLKCPGCGLDLRSFAWQGTNALQRKSWLQHSDLLRGRDIQFYGKEFSASFDYSGLASLPEMLRFVASFGCDAQMQGRGGHLNTIRVAYFTGSIGLGTHSSYMTPEPCAGIGIISPSSSTHGHVSPILKDWVVGRFSNLSSQCIKCGKLTEFGVVLCGECVSSTGFYWRDLL